jgi:L-threonylcarbamoyladenylate synthase
VLGLRVPEPIALLEQLAALGCDGIAAPSANRFGRISATTAKHVADEFGEAIALIIDGGPSRHGIESTIVDFTGADPVMLRPGLITSESLAQVLGTTPGSAAPGGTRAPGTLATHYAPRTRAKLLPRTDLLAALAGLGRPGSHISVLAHSVAQPPDFEGAWFDAPGVSTPYAQQLYANLRALDAREADEIWSEAPPDGPDWVAIGDRLSGATNPDCSPLVQPGLSSSRGVRRVAGHRLSRAADLHRVIAPLPAQRRGPLDREVETLSGGQDRAGDVGYV